MPLAGSGQPSSWGCASLAREVLGCQGAAGGWGGGCLGIWKPDWSGLQSEEEVRSEAVGAASSDFFFLSFLQFYLHTQRRVCSRMPALFLSNLSQIREAQLQGRGR